jgi:ferric-dicitrate binding protein FerR (iron transport regulator)
MDAANRQFERLVHRLIDGIATDAERAELARLSAAHPERVTTVFDELTLDALLKWQSGNILEELPFLEDSLATRPLLHQSRKSIPLWTGLIAATILIATGLGVWRFTATSSVDSLIADIVHQQGVNWSDGTTALAADDAIRRGRLSSTSGEYTLQFRDGSTVRVVGPASLDIKSKMLVQLDSGQATAKVPQGSTGFTIMSPLVDVVDQGTEFGISVEDGRADVVVFDGKVDVKPNSGQAVASRRLTQGQAVKVDREGSIDRLADIRRDVDGRWWGGDPPNGYKNVIAKVTDNIGGSSEVYACYQTTSRGLRDDALAYTDNPYHQWNGLTAEGLPGFLRGADYIRTFNHYRYIRHFEMSIEFSGPADLYVFADNRTRRPDWLVEQFEDTGVDIGLDEGPWLDAIPEEYRKFDVNTTAVGGGTSIDNVFSVWRRRCADGKPITLGDPGDRGEGESGRSMYGVAATLLKEADAAAEAL